MKRRRLASMIDDSFWIIVFCRKEQSKPRKFTTRRYNSDSITFYVDGESAEQAITNGEAKFQSLCGSESRLEFQIQSVERQ